jgi:hypothetical protein
MTAQKDRITRQLTGLGAAWAITSDKFISPDDEFGAMPTYHIHPDASYPHINSIERFDTLREIEEWIKDTRQAQQEHAEQLARECENHMLRSLTELATLTSIERGTLDAAVRAGRLDATRSGNTWLATLVNVKAYKARYTPRPR